MEIGSRRARARLAIQFKKMKFSSFKFQISRCYHQLMSLQKLMNIKDFFEEMDGGGWPESENVFLFEF